MPTQTVIRTITLTHPLNKCQATAEIGGYYKRNGRNVGLVLQFPDGHRASVTYGEIRDLQKEGGQE